MLVFVACGALLVVACGALLGCETSGDGAECLLSSACPAGRSCIDGKCVASSPDLRDGSLEGAVAFDGAVDAASSEDAEVSPNDGASDGAHRPPHDATSDRDACRDCVDAGATDRDAGFAMCTLCGSGRGSPLSFSADAMLPSGRYDVSELVIGAGVTVVVTGDDPLDVTSAGPVRIDGALVLAGEPGSAAACSLPSGGFGGGGGSGGAGGHGGGNGGGLFTPARDGDGPGGGGGADSDRASGGGGGGHARPGGEGLTLGCASAANGGSAYQRNLTGGSGGGGGGPDSVLRPVVSGGGGGGGGAIRIVAPSIAIGRGGVIDVRGGAGGASRSACEAAAGGGGSGGTIWLVGDQVMVTGTLRVDGGPGGDGIVDDDGGSCRALAGGAGSPGRAYARYTAQLVAPSSIDEAMVSCANICQFAM